MASVWSNSSGIYVTTRGVTVSAITPTKYPDGWMPSEIAKHKKMLSKLDLQPEYDGSDIQSTSKAGLRESFSNYAQRVEQWADRIEKE